MVRAAYGRLFNTIMNGTPGSEETTLRQTSVSISNPSYPDPYQGRSPASFASTSAPNISIVADNTGQFINREEYTPYGETGFGSFARKRYRFNGKERDGESGLNYHGARYYAPWIARWVSCDPAGAVDGLNLYAYVGGNPVSFTDKQGLAKDSEVANLDVHTSDEPPSGPDSKRTKGGTQSAGGGGIVGNVAASAAAVAEGAIWNPVIAGNASRAFLGGIASRRGNILEFLAGNNPLQGGLLLAKDADRITGTAVQQLKSTMQLNRVGEIARAATRDAARFIRDNPLRSAGRAPQAQILLRTGTESEVVEAASNALQAARKPITGALSPKVTTGLPGVVGTIGKIATLAGGAYSAYSLYRDFQRGDVSSGVGDAAGVVSSGATIGAGMLGSTALATAGSVTGAVAIGYGVGTVVNKYLAEPLIDRAAIGSGAFGESYYGAFLK